MSDIRFNTWLHRTGSGGVYQDSSGRVGIGSSVPTSALSVVGVVSATSFIGPLTGTVNSSGIATFSNGIVVSAGSTSAPSITPTGDSNTGIFFPSADTIAFAEGGVEAARFDSSGRLGIGTINPAEQLELFAGSERLMIGANSPSTYSRIAARNTANSGYRGLQIDGSDLLINSNTSGNILACTGGGNLGIGTDNPGAGIKLHVVGGEIKAGRVDASQEGGQVSFGRATDNATGWYIDVYGNTSTPQLRFVDVSGSAVRATIDSSGNFQFNSGYGSAATAYGCRAWVNFNGTGSIGANQTIRGSGNVSTVYKNGTGDFTINFTTSMPDANYSATYITGSYSGGNVMSVETYATGSVKVISYTYAGGSTVDKTFNNVAVFR